MKKIKETIVINSNPERIWEFLSSLHQDNNYKKWHPKDHITYILRKGSMGKVGGIAYFEESLGTFTLRLSYITVKANYPNYVEYEAVPPLRWLYAGKGTFTMDWLDAESTKFTAYVEYGYRIPVFGQVFDWITEKLVPLAVARTHIREEGENIKHILEQN